MLTGISNDRDCRILPVSMAICCRKQVLHFLLQSWIAVAKIQLVAKPLMP